ncbi:Inner membrane protein YgaZ [Roseovarius litorisediminis]|uniref:Inner membrane protein YgaZ n=1 Tax=Roseovarius litorisediminis TaxID=1312363 RepID=A0A1Y5RN01_9RHOB|nr:AzlC family ABC transporter permease [Roseovarius litorisediminis]SLN20915.1 Inner membrane protein YgaZ [Roseovarius litorisediminis]
MPTETTKSIFWQGARDGAPFILVLIPFSTLFGVVATEAGLNILEALTFSVAVLAGAAQFTALQLLSDGAPTTIAIISALAVNLRMALYSASLTPYLGAAPLWQRALAAYFTVDQTYASSILKFADNSHWTLRQRLSYFFGVATPICPMWFLFTVIGALVGASVPDGLALDFAIPITFLALIAPMLRTSAHLAAALVSVIVALISAGLPYNLGLLAAGVAGMMAGAQIEVLTKRRAAISAPGKLL